MVKTSSDGFPVVCRSLPGRARGWAEHSVRDQCCVVQHTTGTKAAGVQTGGAARRVRSFVVLFGIFWGFFGGGAAVLSETD